MTLSCRPTKDELHSSGKAILQGYTEDPSSSPYKLAQKPEDEPVIPAPAIFESDDAVIGGLPTVSELAIHLEFLETLYVLRERILRSEDIDNTMGVTRNRETKTGVNGDTKTLKDDTLETRRQEKWTKFIEFAVARFLDWRTVRLGELENRASDGEVPPLDILMVWHTFLLNPLLFSNHCRTKKLYHVPFPWQAIHACIKNRDWSFTLPSDTPGLFDIFTNWDTYLPSLGQTNLRLSTFGIDMFTTCNPPQPTALSTQPKPPTETEIATLPLENPIRTHFNLFHTMDYALATDLKAAVIRQTSFITKMHSHLWIRSPALHGTLTRAITRYSQFLTLMKRNPGKMLVPTLDIDLAWHTHQCAASGYVTDMKERVGRFVNHDDSIDQGELGVGSDETKRLWRVGFRKEYRVCLCWDCEMLVDEVGRELERGEGLVDMRAVAGRVEREVRFHRAVEAARRRGGGLPVREE
ncbi:hypothetical protein OQA88_7047 [Cercophora sp. LCS_1]